MEERGATDIILCLIVYLLLGALLIAVISGVVMLPNLPNKVGTGSTDSMMWLNRSIRYIFIALWVDIIATLLLGIIAAREIKNIRITERTFEVSLVVFHEELERVKNTQKQTMPELVGEKIERAPDEKP